MKKLNCISIAFTVLSLFSVAYADPIDDSAKAERLQAKLENTIFRISGVNGVGITGCEPNTGRPISDFGADFVHCVEIMAETEEAFWTVAGLYPLGKKFDEVYVVISLAGIIEPFPRASGGGLR